MNDNVNQIGILLSFQPQNIIILHETNKSNSTSKCIIEDSILNIKNKYLKES
jgi:hypothetical protein